MHQEGRAEPARNDGAAHREVAGIEAAHEADLDEAPAEGGLGGDDAQAALDRRRKRLLAEHRLAGRKAGEDEALMGRIGRGDQHRLDGGVGDQVAGVRMHAVGAARGRHGGGPGSIRVGDRRERRALD